MCRIACRRKADLTAHPCSLPTGDPRRALRPIPVGHHRSTCPLQPLPLPLTTARSKPTPPLASRACASSEHQAPTRADDESVVQTAGDHADPGAHPSRAAACPTAALHDLTSVGPSGHGHRTSDTGRRTPDVAHWTPGRSDAAPDTGHRWRGQARVDTGRSDRTLDAGRWPRTRTG
jgi:hypothetical protein